MEAQFAHFASTARLLAAEARRRGMVAPGFRSPPRTDAVDRTIRRFRDGGTLVAVRVKGRSSEAVEVDMVEGIVVANGLTGRDADVCRRQLLSVVRGDAPGLAVAA